MCSSIHMLHIIVLCVTQTEQQSCDATALLTDSGCGLFIYEFIFKIIATWAMQVENFAFDALICFSKPGSRMSPKNRF